MPTSDDQNPVNEVWTTISESLPVQDLTPWVCRAAIAPRTWLDAEASAAWVESNGSEGCLGGWEIHYAVESAAAEEFLFTVIGDVTGTRRETDELIVEAFWSDAAGRQVNWDPVLLDQVEPVPGEDSSAFRATFRKRLRRPPNATRLSIRFGLRWSPTAKVRWHDWQLQSTVSRPPRTLRLGVASGRPPAWSGVDGNLTHYLNQCRRAGDAGVQLVCLPETILTWGTPDCGPEDLVRQAVPIPGDWLEPFQQVARDYRMGICFSVYERAGRSGELVYNTAVLLGRDGSLLGTYRKVHLAIGEIQNGITAGHEFQVVNFDGIRVGLLICMDTTASESVRSVAQRGAEIVLMPIMGDFRATPWVHHNSAFHPERWQLGMGGHAFDNHVYFVAARNESKGSLIVAPWGEPLAYNEGDVDVIWADVDVDDHRSHWRGSSIQTILWSMRRPAVYASLADASRPVGPESERC